MLGQEVVDAVLKDWKTAPVSEAARAMLGFLETFTLDPTALGPDDAERLREAGVTGAAAEDAVMVAVAFNLIDRMADSLGFEIPTEAAFDKAADMLLSRGYA